MMRSEIGEDRACLPGPDLLSYGAGSSDPTRVDRPPAGACVHLDPSALPIRAVSAGRRRPATLCTFGHLENSSSAEWILNGPASVERNRPIVSSKLKPREIRGELWPKSADGATESKATFPNPRRAEGGSTTLHVGNWIVARYL